MSGTPQAEAFWRHFLSVTGRESALRYYDCFHFCMDENNANELLALVLAGKKRATAGSLWAYEKEGVRLPQAGDFSIVTDWAGRPRCVIRTTAVTFILI